MPAHRKNFDHAVDMYLIGASIEDVADAHDVSRQSMWKVLTRRGVEMRPKVRSGSDNHFFIHGHGYGPEKIMAKIEVMKAIRSGKMIRQECSSCGCPPTKKDGRSLVHAHHDDYSKPLTVRWLCINCHYAEHHK